MTRLKGPTESVLRIDNIAEKVTRTKTMVHLTAVIPHDFSKLMQAQMRDELNCNERLDWRTCCILFIIRAGQ